jgi:hypothetical protein
MIGPSLCDTGLCHRRAGTPPDPAPEGGAAGAAAPRWCGALLVAAAAYIGHEVAPQTGLARVRDGAAPARHAASGLDADLARPTTRLRPSDADRPRFSTSDAPLRGPSTT